VNLHSNGSSRISAWRKNRLLISFDGTGTLTVSKGGQSAVFEVKHGIGDQTVLSTNFNGNEQTFETPKDPAYRALREHLDQAGLTFELQTTAWPAKKGFHSIKWLKSMLSRI